MKRFAFALRAGLLLCSCWFIAASTGAVELAEEFSVWPGNPPGPSRDRGPEKLLTGRPRPFYQITDVSHPTVSVFLPPRERRTGAAVLVLPGGGLQRLAIEHEGLEVAAWLNSLDIAAFVLKYRVPERAPVALQDVQRAMSLIRARATEWDIDPDDLGVVGFSAGAELAVWLATHYGERQYEALDASDRFSTRPAFAALIYSGGLTQGGPLQIKDVLASRISAETPPMFIAQANDDSSENSLAIMAALKRAHVPAELHIYQEGGHGFGVRTTGAPVGGWKERWREWLAWQGFLDTAPVRASAREIANATNDAVIAVSTRFPNSGIPAAYAVQKRVVRSQIRNKLRVAGFCADDLGAIGAGGWSPRPLLSGVVFQSSLAKSGETAILPSMTTGAGRLVPGLAYMISVDFSFQIATATQAKGAFSAVLPLVEVRTGSPSSPTADSSWDLIANNLGKARFVVGSATVSPENAPGALKVKVGRDNSAPVDFSAGMKPVGRSWEELRQILNQITGEGYTLHAGDLILCPASANEPPLAALPGRYDVDFGVLGSVAFTVH